MFIIDKRNKIIITKGDTATMRIEVVDINGNPYVIKPTDTITFTVRRTSSSVSPVIVKTADSSHYIVINHSDTSNITSGLYVYDIELVTNEGNHYTVIPENYFEVKEEISR